MPDNPLPALLDKVDAPRESRAGYEAQLALLGDLANYGSNLIARCFRGSDRKLPDIILLGVFLKQVIANLDAYQVLLSDGCALAATAHARGILESSLYIDWVLAACTEERAACFYISYLRTQRLWCRRAISGTPENEAYLVARRALIGDDSPEPVDDETTARDQEADIQRLLTLPEFVALNDKFDEVRGSRPFDPPWHEVCGMRSVRKIAEAVGRLSEYTYSYSPASEFVHGSAVSPHLRFTETGLRLMNVRTMAGFESTFHFSVGAVLHTYEAILTHYRSGEVPRMWQRYSSEWRGPFLNVPRARINYQSQALDP